jgi:hypothetical protein
MNIPRFTAEAALYKTSAHYRTFGGRKSVDSSSRTGSQIRAALMEEDGGVIHVHSCAPGYTEIGGVCWQNPLTEPPVGGDDWPPGGGPSDVPPDGGGGGGGGDGSTAEQRGAKWAKECQTAKFPGQCCTKKYNECIHSYDKECAGHEGSCTTEYGQCKISSDKCKQAVSH